MGGPAPGRRAPVQADALRPLYGPRVPLQGQERGAALTPPRSPGRKKDEGWAVDQVVLDLRGSREGVREAFAAACHLLLDCATFPVYLSEEEMEQLCEVLFQPPGEGHPGNVLGGVGSLGSLRVIDELTSQPPRGRCLPTPIFLPFFVIPVYSLGLSSPDGNLRKLHLYLYNFFFFFFWLHPLACGIFPVCSSDCKESASNAEDPGSILGSGRSSGEGNGNPLQ